ncbi:MAG: S-layer homology domain-containing protein [Clostridia bacterium]|nr:S-layer homology domain-containing protein [Clostridia bacterium]
MNFIRRIVIPAILCVALTFTVFAAQQSEIIEKWKELKPSFFDTNPYEQESSGGERWIAGKLKQEFINDGVNYLNFCRYVAGLPEFEYTDSYSDGLQKAAVLYNWAVYYGTQEIPLGMSEDFYKSALYMYDNSLKTFGFDTLDMSVSGMINSRGINQQDAHQRIQMLMPGSAEVSFGFHDGYTTVFIIPEETEFEYDYISWPSNGDFPLELIKDNLPWTVTLNTKHYSLPEAEDITVIFENVKKDVDDIIITSENTYSYYGGASAFLNVNGNTLIFKPDQVDLKGWFEQDSDIRVKVFGIKTAEGEVTSLQYVVKMFDMGEKILEEYADENDVAINQRKSVSELTASKVFEGYPDKTFRPHNNITRAEFTAALLRYVNIQPEVSEEASFTDVSEQHWARGYIDKAALIGAVNGTAPGVFSPDEFITVEQAMKIITVVKGYTENVALEKSGGYPFAYFNLGYELGLLENVDYDDMQRPLTRSDTACIFYNSSNITRYWVEYSGDSAILWYRDRKGNGYGTYSLVEFVG